MKKYTKEWMLSNCSKAGKSKSEKKLRAINENLKKARANRWPDKPVITGSLEQCGM
jgi:hypothetical protein